VYRGACSIVASGAPVRHAPVRSPEEPASVQHLAGWFSEAGRRGKELNLLPLPCAGSALPMSYAPSAIRSFRRWEPGHEPGWSDTGSAQNKGWPFAEEFVCG
jgi:hypothetical protein